MNAVRLTDRHVSVGLSLIAVAAGPINRAVVLMELGRAQGASGYSREAKACFREALRLNPAYTRAAHRLREIHDAETGPGQP